jgi:hypothetical protein
VKGTIDASLVIVEWVDSCINGKWTHEEPNVAPLSCRSVGFVVHQDENSVIIAPHITVEDGEVGQRCGEMTIPTCCIKKVSKLSVSKK